MRPRLNWRRVFLCRTRVIVLVFQIFLVRLEWRLPVLLGLMDPTMSGVKG